MGTTKLSVRVLFALGTSSCTLLSGAPPTDALTPTGFPLFVTSVEKSPLAGTVMFIDGSGGEVVVEVEVVVVEVVDGNDEVVAVVVVVACTHDGWIVVNRAKPAQG